MQQISIERLTAPARESDERALADLLIETVHAGEAVSFLAPLSVDRAMNWWRQVLGGIENGAIVLVARDATGILGTVQLQPAWAPNQPHRAEIVKLLVRRSARRRGLGTRLMCAIEEAAVTAGFRLLTLDTKRGEGAELLYRRLGWNVVGTIPGYAYDPNGVSMHAAVFYYKELRNTATSDTPPMKH